MTPEEKERNKNYVKTEQGYLLTEAGLKTLKDNMQITFELMQNFATRVERLEELAGLTLAEHEPTT